jgi:hypothetical protein
MQKIIRVLTGLAICATASAYAMGEAPAYFKPGFVLGVDGGYGFLNTPDPIYPKGFTFPTTGTATIDQTTYDTVTTVTFKEHNNIGDFVWGVHGGYDWQTGTNSLVGLELGYKDLGESKYSGSLKANTTYSTMFSGPPPVDPTHTNVDASRKIDEQTLDLLLTYHYFVYQGFNVFAKAGVADVYSQTRQIINLDATFPPQNSAQVAPLVAKYIPGLEATTHVWRLEPEMQVGAGYMFAQHVNVYAYYDHIGDSAPSVWDHLSQAKAYGVNSIWAGISYTF